MERKKQKCSLEEHKELDATSFCPICKIYICNKCDKHHSILFKNHQLFSLEKDTNEAFTGFCNIENHNLELYYFCKDHNELCCVRCIAKIKSKGNGQHINCNVCNIEDIIDEKKNNLKSNINTLKELSNTLQSSIDNLKIILEKIGKNKEEVQLKIQKEFTKIRNELNNREDQLLLEVDKEYEKINFNENMLKESQKLPNKIKISLEKGEKLNMEMNDNVNLNSLVYDCVNIENEIKDINLINENIKKFSSVKTKIEFISENIEDILESIKKFGNINEDNDNISEKINMNILDFNPNKIECIKKLSDHCGYGGSSYVSDGICFFISKKNEYVLSYIDINSSNKSIIFYDINDNNEIKKFNNSHKKSIHSIRYYDYNLYDMIMSTSKNDDIKIWNYNEGLNILTISNIFNEINGVYSASLLFENNSFYIICVGQLNYIKIYNSLGNFVKNIGNNDEYRRYINILEINEKKYIVSGGTKGINVFNYPSFTNYNCFIEGNDSTYHNYAKIIKINNVYNLIDIGDLNKIKIWDFFNKNLIKCISSNNSSGLCGLIMINNKYLIVGSDDKNCKVFDMNNGILIKDISKHSNYVLGIKLIIDKNKNKYFVSYGGDYNIYLWSLNQNK